jgi:hypothetical protein
MTQLATINPAEIVGDDLSAAGYTDKEITLIGYCWQDAQEINRSKMALAQHLYELKREMDSTDEAANGGNGGGQKQTRFWAAFEAGHLPFAGDAGRATVKHSLAAADWLHARELGNPLPSSFSNLAPSTVYEISRLQGKALELVEQQLEETDFIGVAAVRLLAAEAQGEVLDRLFDWVKQNPAKVLTPKTIRAVKATLEEENTPASTRTVNVGPVPDLADVLGSIRAETPQREQQQRVQQVKEELSKADREHRELLDVEIQAYNKVLLAASSAVHQLAGYLRRVSNLYGTQLLEELRGTDYRGFITVADDLQRILEMGKDLKESAHLAQSCNPPTGIDMTTVQV